MSSPASSPGPPDPTNLAIDAEMFRHALDNGLALYLYSATAHGYFERRAAGKAPAREYQLPAIDEAAVKLEALAAEAGVRPSEMILAALLQLAPQVRAIIGATSVEQLRQSWKGGETVLPPEIVRQTLAATGMGDFLARLIAFTTPFSAAIRRPPSRIVSMLRIVSALVVAPAAAL